MGGLFSSKAKAKAKEIPSAHYAKIAVCYSYIGTGYTSLEFFPSEVNVENVLMDALVASNVLPPNSFNNLSRLQWQSAVSTEPGSHAAMQVLSLLIQENNTSLDEICDQLNANIVDKNIHFWSLIETNKKFNARKWCEIEHFMYLLPKFVLGTNDYILSTLKEVIFREFTTTTSLHYNYKGAPNRTRIESITIGSEYICDGITFIPFRFKGNHFTHKQIRRMMTVFISVARRLMTLNDVRSTLRDVEWKIPKAPAECLFLDTIEFPYYMRGMRRRPDLTKPDVEFKQYRPQIEHWKTSVLIPHIAKMVTSGDMFVTWLSEKLNNGPVRVAKEEQTPCE